MRAKVIGQIYLFVAMFFFLINHTADLFSSEMQSVLFQHEIKAYKSIFCHLTDCESIKENTACLLCLQQLLAISISLLSTVDSRLLTNC